jgi:hypothetical protein
MRTSAFLGKEFQGNSLLTSNYFLLLFTPSNYFRKIFETKKLGTLYWRAPNFKVIVVL